MVRRTRLLDMARTWKMIAKHVKVKRQHVKMIAKHVKVKRQHIKMIAKHVKVREQHVKMIAKHVVCFLVMDDKKYPKFL